MKIPGSSWFYWGILIFMEEIVNMTQISSENSKGNNIQLILSGQHDSEFHRHTKIRKVFYKIADQFKGIRNLVAKLCLKEFRKRPEV